MVLEQLRHRLRALEKPAVAGEPGCLPLGVDSIDAALGGGLVRGALHEIAATSEAHIAASTGFALGLAAQKQASVCWITEEMALAESGALYGGGLDLFGLAPERLLAVAVARPRDLLWAMEEALRCRAVGAVVGEWRHGVIDAVAVRRLSLAAAESGALVLVLPAAPATDASTAATRWVVGAAPSAATAHGPGAPRFATQLIRNRRGPLGSWILQWSNSDERFLLAPAQPVAMPALDRPHCQNTQRVA
jgi:protein ImuA